MSEPPLTVYSLPPVWGTPSPSPFVIKLLTWFRMAGVPHELAILTRPPRSATGKIPYVVLPDGRMLHDSSLIIEAIGRERGIDLDRGLDAGLAATGHAIRRMLEEHTYWAGVYDRWITPAGFAHTRVDYFSHAPAPVRLVFPWVIRRRMRRSLHDQGLGRHPPAVIAAAAAADLAALAGVLADREFVLGPVSGVDATATAFLWAFSANPFPSSVGDAMATHPNLAAYLARMKSRYWPDGSI